MSAKYDLFDKQDEIKKAEDFALNLADAMKNLRNSSEAEMEKRVFAVLMAKDDFLSQLNEIDDVLMHNGIIAKTEYINRTEIQKNKEDKGIVRE